ncbi:hypothetical protein G7Y89_g4674 [Cudoniella acicularis]|uniref:DlpA domain-containing protein n=1 Tax=Cudoniella acicularis TaxID=354080 RepID=A0A8H4RPS0_9HELO|nr:hypothetical protein G7Y89_g4674 [Cudoniella acicularis]
MNDRFGQPCAGGWCVSRRRKGRVSSSGFGKERGRSQLDAVNEADVYQWLCLPVAGGRGSQMADGGVGGRRLVLWFEGWRTARKNALDREYKDNVGLGARGSRRVYLASGSVRVPKTFIQMILVKKTILLKPFAKASLRHTHKFTPPFTLRPHLNLTTIRLQIRAMATQSQIEALKKYTACDIADALLKLKVPNAGFLPDLKLHAPPPASLKENITIAPASTVIFVPKSGGETSLLPAGNIPSDKHYVDLTEPGTIVVMSQPEGQKCAILGGIMALRMKVLGARGVVVSGRVRDVVELGSTGLPIWAKSTSIVGTGAEAKPHALQVPLKIGGTIVNPGDLVFSDAINGVAVIPISKVPEVLELLPKLVEADERVKEDVERGVEVMEAFRRHRGT